LSAPAVALRVLLVDDHSLLRAGVRNLLERDLGAEVTECDNGEQALRAIAETTPDIAMLDISLRDEDGIELARRIGAGYGAAVRCIMLSMHLGPGYVKRSFEAGARGYVVKDAGPAELVNAVRAVADGQRYLSPSASVSLVDSLHVHPADAAAEGAAPHLGLSPRQLQVLCLVAQGKPTKLIARELSLSTKTVDAHRYQVSQRLQVHDVAGMVRYAIRHGLVQIGV
jgi:DNA-binding NarL/FixJ family response regulator